MSKMKLIQLSHNFWLEPGASKIQSIIFRMEMNKGQWYKRMLLRLPRRDDGFIIITGDEIDAVKEKLSEFFETEITEPNWERLKEDFQREVKARMEAEAAAKGTPPPAPPAPPAAFTPVTK